jgi:hypothetical protein
VAQSSGPISQGTTAERQFTDVLWRDLLGDEPGVLGDMDGTAYALTLPGSGDVVAVGSASQASLARVAGFAHRIAAGSTEPITVPVASGSTRTDIIALRYDPAYTGLPGPVRLVRIAGTTSAVPTYDATPPGIEELPLFSITRAVGQALNLATVNRMFPRLAPVLDLGTTSALPTSSPLGTIVTQGRNRFQRQLVSGSPAWVQTPNSEVLLGDNFLADRVLVDSAGDYPAYKTILTVTATSTGGQCTAEMWATAFNGNSGSDKSFDWRVTCDNVIIGTPFIGTIIPQANLRPISRNGSFTSTPGAGSHTWRFQVSCDTANAVYVDTARLKVSER